MIGGTVCEVCDHPTAHDTLYVQVVDLSSKRLAYGSVCVERNEQSDQIEIGDSVWWQCGKVYWTPQAVRARMFVDGTLRCGVDYDIPIRKIGYSGGALPNRPQGLDGSRRDGT